MKMFSKNFSICICDFHAKTSLTWFKNHETPRYLFYSFSQHHGCACCFPLIIVGSNHVNHPLGVFFCCNSRFPYFLPTLNCKGTAYFKWTWIFTFQQLVVMQKSLKKKKKSYIVIKKPHWQNFTLEISNKFYFSQNRLKQRCTIFKLPWFTSPNLKICKMIDFLEKFFFKK
jgi:hypothetical protein